METQTDLLEIRASKIQGMGAFARKPIASGSAIVEYVGLRIDKRESIRQCSLENHYVFSINEEYDLDGNVEWNPARFINHSCSPNCEAIMEDDDRVWIYAIRDIQPGEEICYNYGYDLESYREHPCRCGSPDCVGFVVAEEFFPHVRKARALEQDVAAESTAIPVIPAASNQ